VAHGLAIQVPAGAPPSLDGVLEPDEWAGAYQDRLSDGGELNLMQDGDHLYVGIRASGEGSGVGSVCMVRGDEVVILHSSAALGTAVYRRSEAGWQQTQGFTWRCRSTSDAPSAEADRDQFLHDEGWLANNGRMGVPGEVEYQIAMLEGSLHLAVSYIGPPDFEAVARWPTDLDDDCGNAQMLQGPIPEQARFDPETWVTISPAETPVSVRPESSGEPWNRAADGMVMVYVPGWIWSATFGNGWQMCSSPILPRPRKIPRGRHQAVRESCAAGAGAITSLSYRPPIAILFH
jgi:hypothetical protein